MSTIDASKVFYHLHDYTVEPCYFKLKGELKNSSKQWALEIPNSKWLKGESKGNCFKFKNNREFEITEVELAGSDK